MCCMGSCRGGCMTNTTSLSSSSAAGEEASALGGDLAEAAASVAGPSPGGSACTVGCATRGGGLGPGEATAVGEAAAVAAVAAATAATGASVIRTGGASPAPSGTLESRLPSMPGRKATGSGAKECGCACSIGASGTAPGSSNAAAAVAAATDSWGWTPPRVTGRPAVSSTAADPRGARPANLPRVPGLAADPVPGLTADPVPGLTAETRLCGRCPAGRIFMDSFLADGGLCSQSASTTTSPLEPARVMRSGTEDAALRSKALASEGGAPNRCCCCCCCRGLSGGDATAVGST
jgi:hypothetical protein